VTKSAHLLAYSLFALLSGWLRVPARYRWMLLFFMMTHGTLTEIIQQHIGRTGCLEDVGLNNAGVLLGVLIGWKWWTDPK
jgi:VanZ family protein